MSIITNITLEILIIILLTSVSLFILAVGLKELIDLICDIIDKIEERRENKKNGK